MLGITNAQSLQKKLKWPNSNTGSPASPVSFYEGRAFSYKQLFGYDTRADLANRTFMAIFLESSTSTWWTVFYHIRHISSQNRYYALLTSDHGNHPGGRFMKVGFDLGNSTVYCKSYYLDIGNSWSAITDGGDGSDLQLHAVYEVFDTGVLAI